jgi:drug/metabolite transporter (DMT)-like permease
VFLFLGEQPGLYTLLGGAVVLVALFTHIAGEFRRPAQSAENEFIPAP